MKTRSQLYISDEPFPSPSPRLPLCPPLPVEILSAILHHLLSSFDAPKQAQSARFTFGGVARSWYLASSSIRELSVGGKAQAQRLLRHLKKEKKGCAKDGREFDLNFSKLYWDTEKDYNVAKLFESVVGEVAACLRELDLRIDVGMGVAGPPDWLFSEAVNVKVWPQLTAVRRLSLTVDFHGSWGMTFDTFGSLFRNLSNLTHLSIHFGGKLLGDAPEYPQALTHLEIVALYPNEQEHSRLCSLLRAFIRSSSRTLQSLRVKLPIAGGLDLEEIVKAIEPVASRLTEFQGHWLYPYPYHDSTTIATLTRDASCLTSLYDEMTLLRTLSLSDNFLPHFLPDLTTFSKLPFLQFASFDLTQHPTSIQAQLLSFIEYTPGLHSISINPVSSWTAKDLGLIQDSAREAKVMLTLRC